VSATSGQ